MSNELLINNPKSNNSDVKSNKQIEEMAFHICALCDKTSTCKNRGKCLIANSVARYMYETEGYRKQSENVIELPCKVGDTVYYIKGGYCKKPEFCEVSRPCKVVEVSLKLQRNKNRIMRGFITDNGTRYSFDSIGKTVFLTKEDAEEALAKMKGGAE